MSAQVIARRDYRSLEEAFPLVDPMTRPYGNRVLVQIRTPMDRTAGGIYLTPDTKETELWNTQVGKVIALGAVAFCNRDTLEPWPEGEWCKVGDFVRCPKYGGDRWFMPIPGSPNQALFAMFKDLELSGQHTGDPLEVVAFI